MYSTSPRWRDRRPLCLMRALRRLNLLRPVFLNVINIIQLPQSLSYESFDLTTEQLQSRCINLNISNNHDSMTRMIASTEMASIFPLLRPHRRCSTSKSNMTQQITASPVGAGVVLRARVHYSNAFKYWNVLVTTVRLFQYGFKSQNSIIPHPLPVSLLTLAQQDKTTQEKTGIM